MYTFNNKTSACALISALILLLCQGCIKNDIPYPRIQPNFTSFVVEDATRETLIDSVSRSVTVYLAENADLRNVSLISYSLSCGELPDSAALLAGMNLEQPLETTLSLYQDYTWTITAERPVERYFTVTNQIGATTIDIVARRVVATVPASVSLSAIEVTSMKLGPEGSVMTPDLTGTVADFSKPVEITVTEHGRESAWTIYINQSAVPVTTDRVDAWTKVAWLYGSAEEGKNNGFQYRKADSEEWINVPEEWMTASGGSFSARLIHLEAETNYVARAFSDTDFGAEIKFTTGSEPQLPNGTMDNWILDGKVWNPWADGAEPFWDTGNKGAATIGTSNSIPTSDTSSGTGQAAKLETRFVGVSTIGKLAAGNIFTGRYVRTDGVNGILNMGRPFTQRPTKVRGYFKYKTAPISDTSSEFEYLKGRPDTCTVWIALTDWSAPLEIRTNPKNRQLFDRNDPHVIAYGQMLVGHDVPQYTPFEVEFEYKATNRVPSYIIVTASASFLGDYFTGGNGAVMYVDDFVLDYDY